MGHRKDLKGQGGWHSGRCLLPGFLGLLLEVLGHKLHLLLREHRAQVSLQVSRPQLLGQAWPSQELMSIWVSLGTLGT